MTSEFEVVKQFFANLLVPSLVRRLVLAQAVTCGLLWGVMLAFVLHESNTENRNNEQQLMNLAAELVLPLAKALDGQPEELTNALGRIDALQRGLFLATIDEDAFKKPVFFLWDGDQLLYKSSTAQTMTRPKARSLNKDIQEISVAGLPWLILSTNSQDQRFHFSLMVPANAEAIGFSPFSRALLVAPLLISLPFLLIPAWLSVQFALKPWRELSSEIEQRRPEQLNPLEFKPKHRELKIISHAINSFLERIQAMRQHEKDFVANAAHEMRTPVAAMQVNAQVLRSRVVDNKTGDLLDGLTIGIERTGRLIGQLLALARTDRDLVVSATTVVDLQGLAQDGLAHIAPLAQQRNIELVLDAPDKVLVKGDEESLRIMFDNIIGNAVKYTADSSIVLVSVINVAKRAEITVSDSGPGIASEHYSLVFERFVRLAGQAKTGSGLGLAIAKNVVERHKGFIRLGPTASGGLRVQITLERPE